MFKLTAEEQQARAELDLQLGVPVVLRDRERSIMILAVESMREDRARLLRDKEKGMKLALSAWRAKSLKIAPYDSSLVRLSLAHDMDIAWLRSIADPSLDLDHPLKGPMEPDREKDPELVRLLELGLRLTKSARLLPALLYGAPVLPLKLTELDAGDLSETLDNMPRFETNSGANLPMALAKHGRLRLFRAEGSSEEHMGVEIGRIRDGQPPLIRLHSACFTGDVLGSLKCDCGEQLHAALSAMDADGSGLLLYLNQEGRGIGLANKIRAYRLQDHGFDTVEANHRLGFEDDERDFRVGAAMLSAFGIKSVRLMTNNPKKCERLEASGIKVVERVPLKIAPRPENAHYLHVKSQKSGHYL